MKGVRISIMAAILLIGGITAYAGQNPVPERMSSQYTDGTGTSPQGGEAPDAKREEIRKKVEAVRMWRLTEELKLDEKNGTRLASFLSAMDEKRRGLMHERMETMKNLRTLVKAGAADEKKLKSDLDKLEKNHREMAELQDKEAGGIKGILSVEQQARYYIFQQDFRREMRDIISGARGNGPGPSAGKRGKSGAPDNP